MTDYPKALAALREARTKFNAEVARVAGPQTLQHRAEELSARVLDFLDALDAQVPSGFAYRYRDALAGGTVIRFNSGHEVNGSRPIEAVPYWLGAPPAPVAPAAAVPAGYVPVSALIEAREEVESWAAYASPYFQDKHDLAEVLAKIDGQIAAAQAQRPAAAVPEGYALVPVADLESLAFTDFGRAFWTDGAEAAALRIRAMLAAERKGAP